MRFSKKHFIVFAMAFCGLGGANRKQILRHVHYLQQINGFKTCFFKPDSNRVYFTAGRGNGDVVSLVHQGLIRRVKRGMYALTPAGLELANVVESTGKLKTFVR
jgi:hypothetical protein